MERVLTLCERIFQRQGQGELALALVPPEHQGRLSRPSSPTWGTLLGHFPPSAGLYTSVTEEVPALLGRVLQRKAGGKQPGRAPGSELQHSRPPSSPNALGSYSTALWASRSSLVPSEPARRPAHDGAIGDPRGPPGPAPGPENRAWRPPGTTSGGPRRSLTGLRAPPPGDHLQGPPGSTRLSVGPERNEASVCLT